MFWFTLEPHVQCLCVTNNLRPNGYTAVVRKCSRKHDDILIEMLGSTISLYLTVGC